MRLYYSTARPRCQCRESDALAAVPELTLPNGVRLHWREAGDPAKPPVVWIHGGSIEDSSSMVADLEPFAARIRALFPDTRGHGLSERFERVEDRSEEHTSELQSLAYLVCRLLLEKKKNEEHSSDDTLRYSLHNVCL